MDSARVAAFGGTKGVGWTLSERSHEKPHRKLSFATPEVLVRGFLSRQRCPSHVEKPLEVVCQCHQRPFRAYILETAQAEAPESEGLFDDPENRLNGLFAQGVEFAPLLSLKAMLDLLLGAGIGPRAGGSARCSSSWTVRPWDLRPVAA